MAPRVSRDAVATPRSAKNKAMGPFAVQTLATDTMSISDQISQIARIAPDSVALVSGDRRLSYGELEQRADRFAGYLAQLGVMPGDTAAICMERSFDWIIAALAIMRAGAAYVPLDTAWPDARLHFALEDSAATVLVARAALLHRLKPKAGVDPQRDAALIAAAHEFVPAPVEPESLGYVIYTSGSTGNPKGVEITHANLSHLARWHRKAFNVGHADRAGHIAGLGFDAAVWELWPNLCAGAAVCLASDAVRSSPHLIQQWLLRDRVTIAFVPSVHAASLMKMEWPADTALRLLLTGGDVLHHGPTTPLPFAVVNNYGPTECTVVATSSVLGPGPMGRPPIGHPITGATVYLLDERGEPVAHGTSGEIYIGGNGVGRGYRNLPESTARCFVPDPFSGLATARMYRTGDLGLRRPDGEIEFRGRCDRQVKIRGQRVELDEIGSVLSQHPAIDFATAMMKSAEGEKDLLVAYVLPRDRAHTPGVGELQRHLLLSLPEYMIPAVFMQLDSVPLSPNGKVDLALIDQPGNARPLEEISQSAPSTPIAKKLLAMVQDILGNKAVTLDHNFFLAGGHSLLGMQLVTRVDAMFGVELSLQQLFQAPTVGALASLIGIKLRERRLSLRAEVTDGKLFALDDQYFGNSAIRRETELMPSSSVLPAGVFALHPQGTRQKIFWLHNFLPAPLAREFGDDQPIFFVTFTAQDNALLGETPSMKDIAACMLRKILTTQPEGPYIISGRCIGSVLAYEVASQLRAAGEEVSLLLMIDAPTQPYLKSHRAWITRLRHPRFYLYRAARMLGWRRSLADLWRRTIQCSPSSIRSRFPAVENHVAHGMIVNAASDYQPAKYEGKVLLLMAKERDPLFDFLSGWKSVVPSNLHAFYVQGRHLELITSKNVREVATLIQNTLKQCSGGDGSSVDSSCRRASARMEMNAEFSP